MIQRGPVKSVRPPAKTLQDQNGLAVDPGQANLGQRTRSTADGDHKISGQYCEDVTDMSKICGYDNIAPRVRILHSAGWDDADNGAARLASTPAGALHNATQAAGDERYAQPPQ